MQIVNYLLVLCQAKCYFELDVVQAENVKVCNSVLVSGLSDTKVDDEVLGDILYVQIASMVKVNSDDPVSGIMKVAELSSKDSETIIQT